MLGNTSILRHLRVALLQLKVGKNKEENVSRAIQKLRSVVADYGPKSPSWTSRNSKFLCILPECFNSPCGVKYFNKYAETIPDGYTSQQLSKVAKELGIYLIAGSIPERESQGWSNLYNTCTVWSPEGSLIAKYRKMHLFDIDISDKIHFRESETISPGNALTTFEIDNAKIGLGICQDMRFEELARIYRNEGCNFLVYPGAFNMKAGLLHWTLLQRSRANDTQSFVAAVSPAQDETSEYVAYGHSSIIDPYARIMVDAGAGENTVVKDLDFSECDKVRAVIPLSKHRREDIYYQTLQNTFYCY
ncbi:omega-amidase NIT2-like isoform X2 [Phlebotomus papatasi]|uniref:omega-amidase NIT2-like isoform X2 n=1 Tax=Phlebotomus papatasi TaxID=29031 RepID=UPI0024846D62|nr:omega-amidase NIT2-like isoform X2 [Phlebotomus papatasi]